jgi:hypothetical protein
VPADYLGLSIEWSMVQHWFGTSRTSVNASLVNLLNSLERNTSTAGVLRIGGNSQDGYQWNQHGSTAGNTLFSGTINAGLVEAVFEVAQRSGWKVVFGLNLRNNSPGMAQDLAKYVVGQDTGGNLLAFEIGNEPNAYLSEQAFLARYQTYVDQLDGDPATANKPITGPAISENADVGWAHDLWARYQATAACRSRPGTTTPTPPTWARCCRPLRLRSSTTASAPCTARSARTTTAWVRATTPARAASTTSATCWARPPGAGRHPARQRGTRAARVPQPLLGRLLLPRREPHLLVHALRHP